MSGLSLFQILRPYVLEAPSANGAVYRRFYSLKELHALQWPRFEQEENKNVRRLSIPQFRKMYNHIEPSTTTPEVLLLGRILSIRKQSSKLSFVDIQSDFHSVQVMLNFGNVESETGATIEQYRESLHTLLRGDFISVVGRAIVTEKGELTLKASKLPTLLSPSLAPIPTKLVNEETMVQNRHLGLFVNQQASDVLRFRSELIWWLRNFFVNRRFLEVQTPILADYAGGATARPFLTSATEFPSKQLALRIAPELWLKRMVVGGFDKIFEIGPAFRNEGLDGTHNPEFTMCEFYQAYSNLHHLIQLTMDLIRELANYTLEAAVNRSTFNCIDPKYFEADFEQIEFIPALEQALGVQFPDLSDPFALELLRDILSTQLDLDLDVPADISLNKLLDNLAGTYIEPASDSKPIFIVNHPACMSPLSKSFNCPKTGQLVSARAELFIKGREIANMYEEENDPFEQRRKMELQVQARNEGKQDSDEGEAVVDEGYIQALEHGLPPTGGWGCGIDRLVMLLSGATRISDTLSFGSLRNVVAATQISKRS
ncbi:hypothetical protein BJ170DRAFT_702336 [Xylariales sp. AK1849]|nr:hypothetical protein BJ170DRAFT_702336 [Xylariales sp. AK1849]